MSAFPPNISPVVICTVLDVLLPLFLRYAGTREAASHVVMDLLIEQAPQTNEELGLAAEIISFRYKALGLIRDSEHPDTPLGAVLQLSKTASALRRNEAAAQRKLDALRRARLAPAPAAPDAQAEPSQPGPAPRVATAASTERLQPQAASAAPGTGAYADPVQAYPRQWPDDDSGDETAKRPPVGGVLAALRRDLLHATPDGLASTIEDAHPSTTH